MIEVGRNYYGPLLTILALSVICIGTKSALAGNPPTARVVFEGHVILVEIADTPELQARGLGGRKVLAPDEGMIFPYNESGGHAFWMRGMFIPIDIIWLRNYRVVHVEPNVPPPAPGTPDRDLPIYRSPVPGNMVLEIAAGRAAELGIAAGSRIDIELVQP